MRNKRAFAVAPQQRALDHPMVVIKTRETRSNQTDIRLILPYNQTCENLSNYILRMRQKSVVGGGGVGVGGSIGVGVGDILLRVPVPLAQTTPSSYIDASLSSRQATSPAADSSLSPPSARNLFSPQSPAPSSPHKGSVSAAVIAIHKDHHHPIAYLQC